MKRIISLLGIIAIMLSMTVSVFAGDIPESLLIEDGAKLFIGKVDGVTTLEHQSMPYEENEVVYIDITPTYKYKGEVEIGVSERHTEHDFGNFIPEKDKEYLFAYIDENNFYIYDIKSRDENSIKLVDSNKYDLTKRLEDYINEGAYARAEQERASLGSQISFVEYLYKNPSLSSSVVEKVSLRIQDEVVEVDKDKFFEVAEDIMVTNVKNDIPYETKQNPNSTDAYKTVLYVELLDANDQLVYYGAISRFGEVDHYALFMSRLMNKDYEMEIEDLQKLYSFLPDHIQEELKVPEQHLTGRVANTSDEHYKGNIVYLIGGAAVVFVIAFVIGVIMRRKKKK